MNKIVKNVIRDCLRFFIGRDLYIKFRFLITHGYFFNLDEPSSWNEKIQIRKIKTKGELYSKYVDKYTVREYVKDTIGEEYLIPLLSKTTRVTSEFFKNTPHQFVIKTSNGGGGENVKVVLDKSKLVELDALAEQFNHYLKIKIGKKIDESFYDVETPQVLMEELLMHKDGSLPSDYKLHIFQGDGSNQEKVIVQVDSDRFSNHKRSLYSESLEKLDFSIQPKYEQIDDSYEFPINMPELISLAKKLAKPFKYVRVDMYNVDGKVYFGELTFCHGSGWEPLSSKDADFYLGSLWKEFN